MAEWETVLGGGGRVRASFPEEDLELANSVRGIIGRRLERLSEPAQRMLVAAAVIGRDFNIALLEAFGELSGHEMRDAIDEATRSHFLRTAGADRFRFSHDLVRQRVLAPLPLPRLQAYHLAFADTPARGRGRADEGAGGDAGAHPRGGGGGGAAPGRARLLPPGRPARWGQLPVCWPAGGPAEMCGVFPDDARPWCQHVGCDALPPAV